MKTLALVSHAALDREALITPRLLLSAGWDQSGAKEAVTGRTGALHPNTLCLGSFLGLSSPSHTHTHNLQPSLGGGPACLHVGVLKRLSRAVSSLEAASPLF